MESKGKHTRTLTAMALFSGIGDRAPQGPLESTITQGMKNKEKVARKKIKLYKRMFQEN